MLSLYTTWSGAGGRLPLASKRDTWPSHKLLNHICLKKIQFPFFLVWTGRIYSLTPCCFSESSSLSRAWNHSARLLSKSDYSRSAPWLQPETEHRLLICGLSTERSKSQGSYQGYLKSAAPFFDRFYKVSLKYSAASLHVYLNIGFGLAR